MPFRNQPQSPRRFPPTEPSSEGEFLRYVEDITQEYTKPKRRFFSTKQSRQGVIAALLVGLTTLSVAGAIAVSSCTFCYAVSTRGTPLAYVGEKESYMAAVQAVETEVSEILETEYAYPEETQVSLVIAPKTELQTSDELKSQLMETVEQVKEEYILTVDGVFVGACETQEGIEEALSQVKAAYTTADTVSVVVNSAVAISLDYLPASEDVLDAAALQARLLAAKNPDEAQPVLNVQTIEEVTYTQEVPAPVLEEPDTSLLVGERKVIQEGVPGLEERTDRLTRSSGVLTAQECLSTSLLTEPIPTRVAVGTAWGVEGAQGRFIWPCMGTITSPFGERYIFGKQGFHTGTDIAAPTGTSIAAAAAGVVVCAEPTGSYGNLVKVDHGNGFLSYYAHCSELWVSEGNWVSQGQPIAAVGSTGRSTGPHCHFELRWQQEPLDPQLCLP